MMQEHYIDTIVVGGGQAGLVTSYYLQQQGREHLVLERASQPAHVWQSERWDSFSLVTPNWSLRLPGAEYKGDQPGEFMGRDQVVNMFRDYAEKFQLPLRYNVRVTEVALREDSRTFSVVTDQGARYIANHVVVATGLFQRPRIPDCAKRFPAEVMQLHSSQYRNPAMLSPGGVLVVGSSQSGCQIAKELLENGRTVYLCVGTSGRAPRRYRGKDSSEWLDLLGLSDRTVDTLRSPKEKFAANPHVSGRNGGENINLHLFARNGMKLLGSLQDVQDDCLKLGSDLTENLAVADKFEAAFLKGIDSYIEKHGLDLPLERFPEYTDGYNVPVIDHLELRSTDIRTVIWATGYSFDFSLVKFPVFDDDGYPIHQRGVTRYPGLYFIGLPWLYKQKSGLISGVGDDAAYITSVIAETGRR